MKTILIGAGFTGVQLPRGEMSLPNGDTVVKKGDFIDARRALRHRRMFRLDGGRGQGDPLDRASTASSVTSAGSIPNGAFNAVMS